MVTFSLNQKKEDIEEADRAAKAKIKASWVEIIYYSGLFQKLVGIVSVSFPFWLVVNFFYGLCTKANQKHK